MFDICPCASAWIVCVSLCNQLWGQVGQLGAGSICAGRRGVPPAVHQCRPPGVARPIPAPCTLHPAPCTLHPAPCTLHLHLARSISCSMMRQTPSKNPALAGLLFQRAMEKEACLRGGGNLVCPVQVYHVLHHSFFSQLDVMSFEVARACDARVNFFSRCFCSE